MNKAALSRENPRKRLFIFRIANSTRDKIRNFFIFLTRTLKEILTAKMISVTQTQFLIFSECKYVSIAIVQ